MNIEKVYIECVTELFKRVGLDFPNKELTDKPDWYSEYTWTMDEEHSFMQWMENYLHTVNKMSRILASKETGWFILAYGWKTID